MSQVLYRILNIAVFLSCLALPLAVVRAQDSELVASLEVLDGGVTIQRAATSGFVLVNFESLVGVGDVIKTAADGRARITFFANGVETDVLPNSEFRIDAFSGSEERYQLTVTLIVGQTAQRVLKVLDSGSSYIINSTGLELAVRGTVFDTRVERSGRSATIVRDGAVKARNVGTAGVADVPAGFGVRAEQGKGLSDVVRAASFAQLDSAIDGCNGVIETIGDVVLNVRIGPGLTFEKIGTLDNLTAQRLYGVTETTQWYRVMFEGKFAWVFAPAVKLDSACAGLRRFPDDTPAEQR
ncbi:MAG: hypothetical protein OHK0023_08410 [Anaerolineae bacterium]